MRKQGPFFMYVFNIMPTLTLLKGDCLEVMKDISANSIDLIICDLPYGVLHAGRKQNGDWFDRNQNGGEGCAWDVKIDLAQFWEQTKRILKNEHSPVIHFCTTKFGYDLIKSNESWFRYDLVWDKGTGVSFLSANKMPMRSHEMIYVFSKAGAYYDRVDISGNFKSWKLKETSGDRAPNKAGGKLTKNILNANDGTKRCVLSVIQNVKSKPKGGHPTEKPIDLYRWLIARYCPVDGTVLDPTFGSGNSVFTAFDMGRNAIGIEKNDAYFNKADEKLKNTIN
jgi:site-specific DNA-methyltransferase (adenine-specific)